MEKLTCCPLTNIPNLRVLGRCPDTNPLTLFWTASGLELCFTGSELWVDLYADWEGYEPWVSIELNGAWLSRFPASLGESRVCVFRGMTAGVPKRVRILKETQAMHDDPQNLLQIRSLAWRDGAFLPLPEPAYRLEFVGDSITSGEGAVGATLETDWISAFLSAENSYSRMTAAALDAEYRVVSQSGWGLMTDFANDPANIIPPIYTQVCGLLEGERNEALGAKKPYDFSAWQPDAVIINLGTNDDCALDAIGAVDGTGTIDAERAAALQCAAKRFLTLVRTNDPAALIVWAYGMMGNRLAPVLQAAVEQYAAETGDHRAIFLALPSLTEQTIGAHGHPGAACHRQAAEVLAAFLKKNL
ncbi:MAG: GDSL-type esterase/lipase family protein [Clostridiales bacterium]|nr:GDSL-type esterase/lipase family protein [Clostridiales bacterium]